MGALRERVATPQRAPPPLAEARHGGVVQRHLVVQPPDAPARRAQPHAQLGLLAGDQIVAKSAHGRERVDAHHRRRRRTHALRPPARPTPDRTASCRSIAPDSARAAAHTRRRRPHARPGRRPPARPAFDQLAVAVDELHIGKIGSDLPQAPEAGIAGAGRREGKLMSSSTTSAP